MEIRFLIVLETRSPRSRLRVLVQASFSAYVPFSLRFTRPLRPLRGTLQGERAPVSLP